jgi:hypothetical protein
LSVLYWVIERHGAGPEPVYERLQATEECRPTYRSVVDGGGDELGN